MTVRAVDLNQHAAEKLHALTRQYGDRPNTRVKDLVDVLDRAFDVLGRIEARERKLDALMESTLNHAFADVG